MRRRCARRARAFARRRAKHRSEGAESCGGRIRRRIAGRSDQTAKRRRKVAAARQVRAQRSSSGGTESWVACAQSGVEAGRRAQRGSGGAGREARRQAQQREAVLGGLRLKQ